MKKSLYTVFFMAMLFSVSIFAQNWTFDGAWPDTSYHGGCHGIVVAPDGNVWASSYYSEDWITPDGDTIRTTPIRVFSPEGELLKTIYTVTSGTVTDTLSGSTRGMGPGQDGNILYTQSGPSKLIEINYQTMEGMGSHLASETGSSPTAPASSSDGTIYVGPVVGGGTTAIAMYDAELNFFGNAVVGPPNIARTMTVSNDGSKIYWTPFTSVPPQVYIYERPDEFSDYALVDSAAQGMSIESVAWNPSNGLLYISADVRSTGPYTPLTWYGLDVTTKALVDSFTIPGVDPTAPDAYPRGVSFSPDGSTAYVGLFGTAWYMYKFSKATGIVKENNVIVNSYTLSQNYPNPFNPTTQIKFTVAKQGFVTLKVYDMLGREVSTLINKELANGSYTVDFNAENLASGTYIYQLNANGNILTNKMSLLK
jgi:hypothetical protein